MAAAEDLVARMPFAQLLGVRVTEATAERVRAELTVRPELCTSNGVMHGGAIMALADSLGAIGAVLALPQGASGTTTIESKTNFLAAASEGATVSVAAIPLSAGRRISVWQTRITRPDGRLVAVVTQTQLVL